MNDETVKAARISHELKMLRRWTEELEVSNSHIPYKLLDSVMAGDLTNEEAFALLEATSSLVPD